MMGETKTTTTTTEYDDDGRPVKQVTVERFERDNDTPKENGK